MTEQPEAADVETLRQEIYRLIERVALTEDAVASIEDGFAGTAEAIETAIRDQPSAPAQEAPEDEAKGGGKKKGPDPAEMTPDLTVLMPWVQDNVSRWCERRASKKVEASRGIKWCPRWFEHPEAVTRLWLVRAAQLEAAEAGPLAVGMYLRDYFDYHLGVLTDANGPFHACSLEAHLQLGATDTRYLPTASREPH